MMSLLTIMACRSSPASPTEPPAPRAQVIDAHPEWRELAIDYPIFRDDSDGIPRQTGSVPLVMRAPPGSRLMENTAYLVLPGDNVVLMTLDETWDTAPRPVSERTFVTSDCKQRRRGGWGNPLTPWPGHPSKVIDGVQLCEGPGDEGEQRDCTTVSTYFPAARLECGAGASCVDEGEMMVDAAVCASVRRSGA
jgi:hypothetical protein